MLIFHAWFSPHKKTTVVGANRASPPACFTVKRQARCVRVIKLWLTNWATIQKLKTVSSNRLFIVSAAPANMTSTENWWRAEIDWNTVAGKFLQKFLSLLPADRHFHIILYGSAPLQLTLDRTLLSGDIDLFSGNEDDLASLIRTHKLGKEDGGAFYLEAGYELSFRTSPRWKSRGKNFELKNVTLTIPHPLDILIGKLDRLAPKDIKAFEGYLGNFTAPETWLLGHFRSSISTENRSNGHFLGFRRVFGRQSGPARNAPGETRRQAGEALAHDRRSVENPLPAPFRSGCGPAKAGASALRLTSRTRDIATERAPAVGATSRASRLRNSSGIPRGQSRAIAREQHRFQSAR
ncbi:MAG: hypothetical protein ABIQ35_15695 [Verrucomicrobiota bacterium]